jgi:cystathionine beta-lyase family protein involved in aluminum resistance
MKAVNSILKAMNLITEAEQALRSRFEQLDNLAFINQEKVLKALQRLNVHESHFSTSSGYGYDDMGRDDLEAIYAEVFGGEDAMVRSQIVSGTHAIAACLLGNLRHGDELISLIGSPYDTLCNVIGKNSNAKGTLVDRGIKYGEVPLTPALTPDIDAIRAAVKPSTRMVLIQRSRGYALRPSLTVKQIENIAKVVKQSNPDTIVMVDNCYGEFTDVIEPPQVGIDLMAGSLIKNPGGGLAPAGGYIVGRSDLVEQAAYQVTAPGLGKELGASLQSNRLLYQGLFLAPHVVVQALKGACLLAYCFSRQGYDVYPGWDESRGDIVQAVRLNNPDEVLQFCQVVQNCSPIDSNVRLEFAPMPGYTDKIIMAAGTFVQGSSIELSCDAPMRPPYCVYIQGGLTYEHYRYTVRELIEKLLLK